MNTEKFDASSVYAMQEEIKELIRKLPNELAAKLPNAQETIGSPIEVDLSAVEELSRQVAALREEQGKPQEVRHRHTHTVDIRSNKVLFTLFGLVLVVLALAFVIRDQRQTISQYRGNDLKYRYIYMKGAATGADITNIERLFQYSDSVRLIRKRIEEYERLVREQAERMERSRREAEVAKQLKEKANNFKKVP
jgi:uncharacterized spore protein YtfJ